MESLLKPAFSGTLYLLLLVLPLSNGGKGAAARALFETAIFLFMAMALYNKRRPAFEPARVPKTAAVLFLWALAGAAFKGTLPQAVPSVLLGLALLLLFSSLQSGLFRLHGETA